MFEGQILRSWLLVGCLVFLMGLWVSPSVAHAQAPGANAAADAPTEPAPESMLTWIVRTSGWIGLIILGLSVYLMASIISNMFELRRTSIMPPELVEECAKLVEAKDFNRLYQVTRQDGSFLGDTVAAGLEQLRHGIGESREAMERTADALIAEMDRKISMIAVIGTLGPMIGLLGTLKGMITAFSVIARSNVALRPAEVAGGISEALLLTFEGVGLSIPAIFFFAFFRNRITAFTSEAASAADGMIRRVLESGRTRSPGDRAPDAAASNP